MHTKQKLRFESERFEYEIYLDDALQSEVSVPSEVTLDAPVGSVLRVRAMYYSGGKLSFSQVVLNERIGADEYIYTIKDTACSDAKE